MPVPISTSEDPKQTTRIEKNRKTKDVTSIFNSREKPSLCVLRDEMREGLLRPPKRPRTVMTGMSQKGKRVNIRYGSLAPHHRQTKRHERRGFRGANFLT